jgi:hypothetical protein
MWEGAPCSEMISPSTYDASTTAVEEVVAWGASASSVEAWTGSGDDVAGSSTSSSSPSMPYSPSSTKILSSISLSPAHWKTSRGQGAISLKVTSDDSTMVLVLRLNTIRSARSSIAKHDAIRRTRLKLIKISTFQNKALASKRPEMRDGRVATKPKLKGSQM